MGNWKDIPGHEGRYQISDQGRVRSLDRLVHRKDGRAHRAKGKILDTPPNAGGYPSCRLGRGNPIMVHQTMALVFIGPAEGRYACHNDGNRGNNQISNIRYDTPKGNQGDRPAHGTDKKGSQLPHAKLNEAEVAVIKTLLGKVSHEKLGARYGVCAGTIGCISRGVTWKHVIV